MKEQATGLYAGRHFHVVAGANRMSLYDRQNYVDEAVLVLAPLFLKHL